MLAEETFLNQIHQIGIENLLEAVEEEILDSHIMHHDGG